MIFLECIGSRASLSATCKDANHICGSHLLFVIICNVLNITRLLNEYGGSRRFDIVEFSLIKQVSQVSFVCK